LLVLGNVLLDHFVFLESLHAEPVHDAEGGERDNVFEEADALGGGVLFVVGAIGVLNAVESFVFDALHDGADLAVTEFFV